MSKGQDKKGNDESRTIVLCGVGGGLTGGDRTVRLSKDAEAQGASGVVVNAPMTNDVIEKMAKIPVEVDVASEFRYKDP